MSPSNPFRIIFLPLTRDHLRTIERKYYSMIRETIEEQLSFEPTRPTRNRAPLKRPILGAQWKLRFGLENQFRVYFFVEETHQEVYIVAIAQKKGNRLYIGGEEFEL